MSNPSDSLREQITQQQAMFTYGNRYEALNWEQKQNVYCAVEDTLKLFKTHSLQERIDELETHRDANRIARATKSPEGVDILIHDQIDVLFNKRISALKRQLEAEQEAL